MQFVVLCDWFYLFGEAEELADTELNVRVWGWVGNRIDFRRLS